MKRRVIQFFIVLLVFVAILTIAQVALFGGMTLFAIDENDKGATVTPVDNFLREVNSIIGFNIEIESYDINGGNLKVNYKISELFGKSQEIKIVYYLYGKDVLIEKGEREVVVEAGKDNLYSLEIEVPDSQYVNIVLEAYNEKGFDRTSKEIVSKGKINAFAVSGGEGETLSWLGVILISALLIVLFLRYMNKKQRMRHIGRGFQKGLIKLDLGVP